MWQYLIIGVLCLATSSNALSACNINGNLVQDELCPANDPAMLMDSRSLSDEVFKFVDETLRNILRDPTGRLCLDPLAIADIPPIVLPKTNNSDGAYEPLSLNLTDVVVHHLSDYVVYNASYSISGFMFPIALDFPAITLTGKYNMDGWLGDGLLYLFGNGDLTFSLTDTSLFVELDVGTISLQDSTLVLECLAIDVNFGGAESNIEGLLGGGELGEFFNDVLEDAVPTILNLIKDRLIAALLCPLREKANTFFVEHGVELSQLTCVVLGNC